MQKQLKDTWGINATVLYDRPPAMFKELTIDERHELFKAVFGDAGSNSADETLFTRRNASTGRIELRSDRPALIVSSTSWTPDEDFQILLNAVIAVEERVKRFGLEKSFPKLEFVITGRGPLRDYYERKISELNLEKCHISTKWLAAENYPKLLGSADLGICLHFSSSGVDLPMKVVDMFGSALPVCAIDYKTLPELVLHDKNGFVFKDSEELTQYLMDIFTSFPKDTATLNRFQKHLKDNFQQHRWDDEWSIKARGVFLQQQQHSK